MTIDLPLNLADGSKWMLDRIDPDRYLLKSMSQKIVPKLARSWSIRLAKSILLMFTGWSIIIPVAIAGNLPPANDIPEEILRAELIIEARSPIDGKPLSATEFAELIVRVEQQLARDDATAATKNSPFKDVLLLIRLRKFLKNLGIPVK